MESNGHWQIARTLPTPIRWRSQSGETYTLTVKDGKAIACTCAAFTYSKGEKTCKHCREANTMLALFDEPAFMPRTGDGGPRIFR